MWKRIQRESSPKKWDNNMCERFIYVQMGHLGKQIFVARHSGEDEKGVGLLAIELAPHDPLPPWWLRSQLL